MAKKEKLVSRGITVRAMPGTYKKGMKIGKKFPGKGGFTVTHVPEIPERGWRDGSETRTIVLQGTESQWKKWGTRFTPSGKERKPKAKKY